MKSNTASDSFAFAFRPDEKVSEILDKVERRCCRIAGVFEGEMVEYVVMEVEVNADG